jgi:hypothetical protein
VTYNNQRRLAPRNNTKFLTKMAAASYDNFTISVVLTTKGYNPAAAKKFYVGLDSQLCPPRGCPVPPVPDIGTPMLWSNKLSWQNQLKPVAGQKVTIDANMWIVMDITPPTLGSLVVYGKLSFLSNVTSPRSLTLTVKDISIYGTMEIVGERDENNATTPFVGDATVVLYGTKGSSLPIVMGEGVYLGTKVIGVAGQLLAKGVSQVHSFVRLSRTLEAGSMSAYVRASTGGWRAGDQVVVSPTGYYNERGDLWSKRTARGGSSDEILTVRGVEYLPLQGEYRVNFTTPVNHTHLCLDKGGNLTFCGVIGRLSRSVRFISRDSENPTTSSYGYGGHVHVLDYATSKGATPVRRGMVDFEDVEFRNFGKLNSDRYAIRFQYVDYLHSPSRVHSCSFNQNYNFAARAEHTQGFTFTHNVAVGTIGGGVFVTADNIDFDVSDNLVVGTRQLPSVLLSSYAWLRPIASYTIQTKAGVFRNNVAAGSEDQGFGSYFFYLNCFFRISLFQKYISLRYWFLCSLPLYFISHFSCSCPCFFLLFLVLLLQPLPLQCSIFLRTNWVIAESPRPLRIRITQPTSVSMRCFPETKPWRAKGV